MFERFTQAARQVVVQAQEEARSSSSRIGTEHLLLGLLTQPDSMAARVLEDCGVDAPAVRAELTPLGAADAAALAALGVDLDAVRRRAEAAFGAGALERSLPRRAGLWRGRPPFSREAKQVLERSLREAVAMRHCFLGSGHILVALLADEEDPAVRLLRRRGVRLDVETVRARVLEEVERAA